MTAAARHSAIYRGRVWHRRHAPRAHDVDLSLHMMYLDLEELPALDRVSRMFGVERAAPLSFRRRDYFGDPDRDLADAVRDRVGEALGARPTGPVRLLTQVRSLGYVFNPVSFYYCHGAPDREGIAPLRAILAEITNTPWGERHAYVVPARDDGEGAHAELAKRFHVSPFMPMNQRYSWRFTAPGTHLGVHMRNREGDISVFDAGLTLHRHPFDAATLTRAFLRQPAMSLAAHAAIYAHALRLLLKGVPFHPHPRKARLAERTEPTVLSA